MYHFNRIYMFIIVFFILLTGMGFAAQVERVLLLPPGPDNPRNSEGDFIQLDDGRILFVYTHFTGGESDHATAYLASRESFDQGQTWSDEDEMVIPNEGDMNIMSVSLLRLQDHRIALFYMIKNSMNDCRPVMRISTDNAKTWSKPVSVIPEEQIGYYVLNNDRVVQLNSGRLVVPVSRHNSPDYAEWTGFGDIMCYLSDDNGSTWYRSSSILTGDRPPGHEWTFEQQLVHKIYGRSESNDRVLLQEPGVVELMDGRLMMWCRTTRGRQYVSYSSDQGKTWCAFKPSNIISPRSPASIERLPSTGDLLLVWNNHENLFQEYGDTLKRLAGEIHQNHRLNVTVMFKGRSPFSMAISGNEGQLWHPKKTILDNPYGWYCYTAIEFVDDFILLGHCSGDRRENNGLAQTQITRVPLEFIYRD